MRYGGRTIAVIRRIIRDAERKHLMLAAAGLAFYFLMSLFPSGVVDCGSRLSAFARWIT
jgi:uncharacterized BrkB/YihY/UPF0761 family membrane protein